MSSLEQRNARAEELTAKIVAMRGDGCRNREIATELGLTEHQVKGFYRRRNDERKGPGTSSLWTEGLTAQLTLHHQNGLSDGKIAKMIGVSRSAVRDQRSALGLPAIHKSKDGGGARKRAAAKVKFAFNKGPKCPRSAITDLRVHPGDPEPIGPVADLDGGCHWIFGDTRTPDWQCCGHERDKGSAYCKAHRNHTINHQAMATMNAKRAET